MGKRRANGEGSIYVQKRDTNGKPTQWAASYTDNVGKRRTVYGKTQQIVKDKLKEAIRQSDNGINLDKEKITFHEWLKEWLEVYSRPVVKEKTYSIYHAHIYNHFIPDIPNVLLKDLRPDMLQRYFNKKAISGRRDKMRNPDTGELEIKPGGLSSHELHKQKTLLKMVLAQAVDNKIIPNNVICKVRLAKKTVKEITALTLEEQKKVEEAARLYNDPTAFGIILTLYTGLRIGELLALKIEDIDFERKELYVRRTTARVTTPGRDTKTKIIISEPKTDKAKRAIPLPDSVLNSVREYLEIRDKFVSNAIYCRNELGEKGFVDNGYLFLSTSGNPKEKVSYGRMFKKILRLAEVRDVNFHALRHTFATRCLEEGFDIKSLSDILGHTDAKMTLNTYIHALPDQKRSNMERLSSLYEM